MAENYIRAMNRCTGPAPCHCQITGPHDPSNENCPRTQQAAQRRANFDAKVRTHGYVDRVTGERIYGPDRLTAGMPAAPAPSTMGADQVWSARRLSDRKPACGVRVRPEACTADCRWPACTCGVAVGAPGYTDAERAAWLADKIVALGDYAKEAAAMLRRWPSGVPAAERSADSMGKLISALEFVIRHSDSLTPSDIQRMQAILAEVGDKQC